MAKKGKDRKSGDAKGDPIWLVSTGASHVTAETAASGTATRKRARSIDDDIDDHVPTKSTKKSATNSDVGHVPNQEQAIKEETRKRTREDLEFEWDRTGLRDPRLTPERIIPPRRREFDLTEDEKALFKGPPAKRPRAKGRLTAFEKDETYRAEIRTNIPHCFHEMYVCYDKSPNGSPTYDESGFQFDYHKVADWMKPRAYNKRSMVNGMEKALKRQAEEKSRMEAPFFEGGKGLEGSDGHYALDLLKDKVSKDLGIALHKIKPDKLEEWAAKGFPKENPCNYIASTVTAEERKRFLSLLSGGSLRA